jgi:ABC-type antimicrobial peptide transport system ATPase subunit
MTPGREPGAASRPTDGDAMTTAASTCREYFTERRNSLFYAERMLLDGGRLIELAERQRRRSRVGVLGGSVVMLLQAPRLFLGPVDAMAIVVAVVYLLMGVGFVWYGYERTRRYGAMLEALRAEGAQDGEVVGEIAAS